MARKEKKYHFIYKTTNVLSGKYYIGMHSTSDLNDGYLGSGTRLRYSINKHGKENFVREILEYCETREELKSKEIEIVNLDEIAKVECMNLKIGGYGGFSNEEHRLKCQKAGNKAFIDKIKNDDDFKNVITNTLIKNIKQAHKDGKFKYGNFKDKSHSEETKELMSESSKGTGIGKTNSQYGTCWITKDGLNKKIKKEFLDSFIEDGWVKNNTCECGNMKSRSSTICKTCSDVLKRKFDRPSKGVLLNEIKISNYSALGRKYGVSDNTIRKWLK